MGCPRKHVSGQAYRWRPPHPIVKYVKVRIKLTAAEHNAFPSSQKHLQKGKVERCVQSNCPHPMTVDEALSKWISFSAGGRGALWGAAGRRGAGSLLPQLVPLLVIWETHTINTHFFFFSMGEGTAPFRSCLGSLPPPMPLFTRCVQPPCRPPPRKFLRGTEAGRLRWNLEFLGGYFPTDF